MVDYAKLEHQINLSGSHEGKFENCPERKRICDDIKGIEKRK